MSWISYLIASSNSEKHTLQQQTFQTMGRDMPSFQNIVSKFLEKEIKYVVFKIPQAHAIPMIQK